MTKLIDAARQALEAMETSPDLTESIMTLRQAIEDDHIEHCLDMARKQPMDRDQVLDMMSEVGVQAILLPLPLVSRIVEAVEKHHGITEPLDSPLSA